MRDGGDDIDLSEVLEHLFTTLGINDPDQHAHVVDQVRRGLRDARQANDLPDDGTEDAPRVFVLDGGRSDSFAANESTTSDDDDDSLLDASPRFGDVSIPFMSLVGDRGARGDDEHVTVGDVQSWPRAKRASLVVEGQIIVSAGGEQVLLFSKSERHLRVQAHLGALQLTVDGQVAATLEVGQTIDLVGCVISARATSDAEDSARGRYVLIG